MNKGNADVDGCSLLTPHCNFPLLSGAWQNYRVHCLCAQPGTPANHPMCVTVCVRSCVCVTSIPCPSQFSFSLWSFLSLNFSSVCVCVCSMVSIFGTGRGSSSRWALVLYAWSWQDQCVGMNYTRIAHSVLKVEMITALETGKDGILVLRVFETNHKTMTHFNFIFIFYLFNFSTRAK